MSDKNDRVDGLIGSHPATGAVAQAVKEWMAQEEPLGRALRDMQDAGFPGSVYIGDDCDQQLPEFVVLHLGCGRKQRLEQLPPIVCRNAEGAEIHPPIRLVNLDGMAEVGAHLTARLGEDPIPLPDDSVDLVLAFHVLEHIGRQGELAEWFQFWGEAYRVLKPGGRLQFLSPYYTSVWCWGDPTHSRAMSEVALIYLDQNSYRIPAEQTAIPDYRPPCDFQLAKWWLEPDSNPQIARREPRGSHMGGVLVARKPFRPYWEDAR
jgi:SAM-dependent methyltransferase